MEYAVTAGFLSALPFEVDGARESRALVLAADDALRCDHVHLIVGSAWPRVDAQRP
jgi:hypothetical protein